MKSLSKRHQQQIAGLQPYLLDPTSPSFSLRDQGNAIYWQRVGLQDIHELNNLDKHRRLSVVNVATQGTVVENGDFQVETRFGQVLSPSDWSVRRTYRSAQAAIPQHPGLIVNIGLENQDGKFPHMTPWMQFLHRIVGEIIDRFRTSF